MKVYQTERGFEFGFKMAQPTEEFNAITVSVYHSQGGINYFNDKKNPKGHVYSLRPSKVDDNGSSSFMVFDNKQLGVILDEDARMSKKKMRAYIQTLFEQIRDKKGEHYDKIVAFYTPLGITIN